ncbi:protein DMR6-LIKE OXYGENASE 2-like isoform X3 [Juglans regia]|uniref:Protein DMR6-LIKE OXYGENASE 2-like isoform X3 n=1 Tax=Juglans regia TaxID=51240 RepID=A0A6P9DZA0_JUGRE|nr:protein DMR6-LIKE OXYGENASE 2-like isoform X3 [Juglans regia]
MTSAKPAKTGAVSWLIDHQVINHGVPESLMKAMVEACGEFFNLAEEEKQEFAGKHVLDSLRCGASINGSTDHVFFWRDYLKFFAHPNFHSPSKPTGFREIALDYSTRTRKVAMELVKGISASLGLEEGYIEKALNMELGLQIFISNFFPPCPQPELARGLPPHSDHALLTLLINNGISGFQLQRQGKWVNVNSIPNAFMVIFGDQMEIMSNGKYECAVHRATVNGKATRMSIAMLFGPALETVVGPAPELVDNETNPPAFTAMKYRKYLELQQTNKIIGKCALDRVRILSV